MWDVGALTDMPINNREEKFLKKQHVLGRNKAESPLGDEIPAHNQPANSLVAAKHGGGEFASRSHQHGQYTETKNNDTSPLRTWFLCRSVLFVKMPSRSEFARSLF